MFSVKVQCLGITSQKTRILKIYLNFGHSDWQKCRNADEILNPFSLPNSENLNSVPPLWSLFLSLKKRSTLIVFEILRIMKCHTVKLRTCHLSQSTVHTTTWRHISQSHTIPCSRCHENCKFHITDINFFWLFMYDTELDKTLILW